MPQLLLFNKPFGVICQFTSDAGGKHETLADYISLPDIYPAGRLDADSEGLLLLTDEGSWQAHIADPRYKRFKTYWVQVEGVPDETALQKLRDGLMLKDGMTRPAQAELMADTPVGLWPRVPPIRFRAAIPTSWIILKIREGRNRQVRRMTAAVGHPTLRLIRYAVDEWTLDGLKPGEYRILDRHMVSSLPSPATYQRRAHRDKAARTNKGFPKSRK